METIVSERSFFKFYIAIFFIDLFWGLMSLVTGAISSQGITLFGRIIMIAMSTVSAFMVFYTIFRYYKNAPRIVINDNAISFNSQVYYWRDVEKIEMTGKFIFKFMGERKEGMLLKFKGEKERYIFDDMYENSPEIKYFIEAVTKENATQFDMSSSDEILKTPVPMSINREGKKTVIYAESIAGKVAVEPAKEPWVAVKWYKGFPLYSFQGIILWGMIAFFVGISIVDFSRQHHKSIFIMMTILSVFFFILLCRRFNYFGISNDSLIIKNHNFFWLKNAYSLEGIKEVVFEQRNRMPVTLRIIFKDFTSATYPASTLWNKTWMQLKADLESKGIKVRNECVTYEPFEFKFFND